MPPPLTLAQGWFDLSKYDQMKEMTPYEWGQQIAKRHFIKCALDHGFQDQLEKAMPELMSNPCATYGYEAPKTPLRPLAVHDLDRLKKWVLSGKEAPSETIDDLQEKNLQGTSSLRHLVIDLSHRKHDLLKGLEDYLSTPHNTPEPPDRSRDSNPQLLWHAQRLIPYFDITAWARWSKNSLSESDYLALLAHDNQQADRGWLRNPYNNMRRISLRTAHYLMSLPLR